MTGFQWDGGQSATKVMYCLCRWGCGALPLVAGLLFAGCTSERDRLNAEANRLCALDGGITVHETVPLPPEKFNALGQPLVPIGKDVEGWGYYIGGEETLLMGHEGGPKLMRNVSYVVRTSDGKKMAVEILYRTGGGEFMSGYLHYQSKICPERGKRSLPQYVFNKVEKQ